MLSYFSIPKIGMQLQAKVMIGGRQWEKPWPGNGLKSH